MSSPLKIARETVGRILDRGCFWALPGWVRSYRFPVPLEIFFVSNLEIWFIPGKGDGPTVLFCHGNSGNLRFPPARRNRLMAIHETGADLWVFDYRGYGRSAGSVSEAGLYEDARIVHSAARAAHRPERPFLIFGRSLGGAVATYLATEVQTPDCLILESTFTSAPEVCAGWVGPRLADCMTYRFDSLSRIERLSCPLRMIHGGWDRVVPHRLGRKLYERFSGPKEFVTVAKAGHNNLQQVAGGLYEKVLDRWIKDSTGA